MRHVVLALRTIGSSAEQNEHERAVISMRQPHGARVTLPVLLDDAEPAIAFIEGDRLIEVAYVQGAMGEFRCHSIGSTGVALPAAASARKTAATASRISPNRENTQ